MAKSEQAKSFEEYSKSDKGKGRKSSGRGRGGFGKGSGRRRGGGRSRTSEKTKVTCSSCGVECEVPFKPDFSKPVYCDSCFAKKGGSSKISKEDIDSIHEKLDKIMKSLKIE